MVIYCYKPGYANRGEVEDAHPAAAVIKAVCGGWAVFETYEDYETWRRQK